MTGTSPPPQPLPMWYGTENRRVTNAAGKYSARKAPIGRTPGHVADHDRDGANRHRIIDGRGVHGVASAVYSG